MLNITIKTGVCAPTLQALACIDKLLAQNFLCMLAGPSEDPIRNVHGPHGDMVRIKEGVSAEHIIEG